MPEPGIGAVRRALRGKTFKRGRVETRGRKKKLLADAQAAGEYVPRWQTVMSRLEPGEIAS